MEEKLSDFGIQRSAAVAERAGLLIITQAVSANQNVTSDNPIDSAHGGGGGGN